MLKNFKFSIFYNLLLIMIICNFYLSYKYVCFYFGIDATNDEPDLVTSTIFSILLSFPFPIPLFSLVYTLVITALYFFLERGQEQYRKIFVILVILGSLINIAFLVFRDFFLNIHSLVCLASHLALVIFTVLYWIIPKSLPSQ